MGRIVPGREFLYDTHDFLHGNINLFQEFFIHLEKGAFNQPLVVDRTDLVDHQIRILVQIAGGLNAHSQGFGIINQTIRSKSIEAYPTLQPAFSI